MDDPKLETVKMILALYPEWIEGDEWVRMDRDSEVISCGRGPVTRRHGYVFGRELDGYEMKQKIPCFASKGSQWEVIGHYFERFEFEIFKARVIQENADGNRQGEEADQYPVDTSSSP